MPKDYSRFFASVHQRFLGLVPLHSRKAYGSLQADLAVPRQKFRLCSREDEPAVAEVLKNFYERSVCLSKQWILSGQQHGVIMESVDPNKTAEMFVLLSLGLRVRSSLRIMHTSCTAQDLSSFMVSILNCCSSWSACSVGPISKVGIHP
jgi:hypothetical protein